MSGRFLSVVVLVACTWAGATQDQGAGAEKQHLVAIKDVIATVLTRDWASANEENSDLASLEVTTDQLSDLQEVDPAEIDAPEHCENVYEVTITGYPLDSEESTSYGLFCLFTRSDGQLWAETLNIETDYTD